MAAFAANCRADFKCSVTAFNELRVTIYDQAQLQRDVLIDALDQLHLILLQAKIASSPVIGNPADPEASLFMYVAAPSKGEGPQMACDARRDIALKIVGSSPTALQESVLGMASPFAAFGLNVRVFNDHIYQAALWHDLSPAMVLAYAMAHEIGHVLLKSGSHAGRGMMSSTWTKYEYERMAHGALLFSDDEVKKMSTNLLTPACDKPDHRPTWRINR